VAFRADQKVTIARLLDGLGVAEIEAGTPAMGPAEAEAVGRVARAGLSARVRSWNRAVVGDVEASLACGVEHLSVCLPVSDLQIRHKLGWERAQALDRLHQVVTFARKHGGSVCVGAEDASRADPTFLASFARCAAAAGAERVRFSDTVGRLDPFATYDRVRALGDAVDLPLEVHTHNDLGLATANALAGVRAGATHLSVTVLGLGERAGNAALEEVAVSLRHALGMDPGIDLSRLPELFRAVARASGRAVPVAKPVAGQLVFTHESGIHADGVLKCPATYEAFPPAEVGRRAEISFGKHSGRAAVRHLLEKAGICIGGEEARRLLHRVGEYAQQGRGPLNSAQVLHLYGRLAPAGTREA
jgi:homocitrate synthase NifV